MRAGKKKRVHMGLIEACHGAGIPVLPVALAHTEWVCPTDVDIRPFRKIQVSYLQVVHPRDFEKSEDFARYCWNQVEEEFAALSS